MRCFIAIEFPEHVKARIFHKFETLQNQTLFRGKFVEKENLHLTLKFLGEITNKELEKIKKRLNEIKFERFDCHVGKTGFFKNEDHIRVIWVELVSEKLNELQKRIDEATSEIPRYSKKFDLHITTARVKSILKKQSLIREVKKIHFKNLDFEITEFFLMKSELFPEGAKHKSIEKFKLKK
jgi:2'-5' RNA ligase